MAKEIRAGVAGCGVFGGYHASKYAALAGVRLAAVFDCDDRRAEILAERYGAAAYTDYDAFLSAVDAVTISTPATTHLEYAKEALIAGRDALVEKPIAMRIEESEALLAIAFDGGRVLQVGHQERFVAEALGLFEETRAPRNVSCRRVNPRSGRGEDVSVVFDLMIHDIDLLRRLPLGPLAEISAYGTRDDATAELIFVNGSTATLHASRLAPLADRRMTIDYPDGSVAVDFVARDVRDTTRAGHTASALERAALSPAFADPLGFSVAKFVAAVRGQGECPIPGEAGRDALEWAVQIEDALLAPAFAELRRAVAG